MQSRWIAAFLATLLTLVALVPACTTGESTPELLHLVDVLPREAEVGDRMEVVGAGFPEGKAAKVVFEGTLFRPGHKPSRGFEIAVDAVSTSASRVELTVTESLLRAFVGQGEKAIHTTFEGNVLVSFPGKSPGALRVTGSVRNIRLDFHPPLQRRAITQARERDGDRALDFMGISVAADAPASVGLLVTEVRRGSTADHAGIFAGDLVTSFDGVRVFGRGDIGPAGSSRFASIGLVRGAGSSPMSERSTGREVVRSISIQGFQPSAPSDLLGAGLLLILTAASVLLFAGPLGRIATWLERRILARLQEARSNRQISSSLLPDSRRPQRHGWILAALRLVLRQDVLPSGSGTELSRIAPYLVFLGVSAVFVAMPFGQHLVAPDLDLGILFVVAVTLLVTMGLLTGGYSPRSEWSWRKGFGTAAQIISYEIPGAVAIACIVMMTGSLRIQDIVVAQGGWPWQWLVFKSPVSFALFFLWMATSLFGGAGHASELPQAASERAAPSPGAREGMRHIFYFFVEWGNVFVMCGLASALFLGGWQLPGIPQLTQESSFFLQALGALWFQLKSWLLISFVVLARWALPRVRMDRMHRFSWTWLVPSTFGAFALTAIWILWSPPEVVETLVALGTFGMWLIFACYFVARLRHRRAASSLVQLNPLL